MVRMLSRGCVDLDAYRNVRATDNVHPRTTFSFQGNKNHIFLTNGWWQEHNVEDPLCSHQNTNARLIRAPSILHCNKYSGRHRTFSLWQADGTYATCAAVMHVRGLIFLVQLQPASQGWGNRASS